ncbi:SAM-dependent chlorinase/fluorinase [Halostella sp. JP-L12]|uniref:SAM hydrolase/SAM-dependent halogenase family protein n=1 Tax=Halostella TaxID=1843185 RepID=UPI000EF795EA|nr:MULTISPECIES: SAM-dependent chlorinase/fluorinase [Halostella]NHN47480.1 SAM-dependent chlorinase/fluorinase [Halostella sp. JP-L12]
MITLASDFGTPYPAAMKGVILDRTEAQLVDVAHDFPRQDVRAAAFWLREVLPWFPPAVHLVVVDPGVGTDRAAVVVRAGDHALVGPDNGVLVPAARELAGESDGIEVFEIDDEDARSSTFHGRDVFAPAAADVHRIGVDALDSLDALTPVDGCEDLSFPEPSVDGDDVVGEVLVVDGFGNAITNVPGDVIEGAASVRVNGQSVPVGETFAAVPQGQWLVTVGSHGNVELDVNRGRGDEAFGVEPGDDVRLSFE